MFGDRQFDEQIEDMEEKSELRTPEQELAANAHWKDVAYSRLRDQLRHHPAQLAWGRIKAIARSFATPTYPSLSSLTETNPKLASALIKSFQGIQTLVLLIPAAAAVWIRRKDRRVLLLASLPVVTGLAYAAVHILPRYVFPVMPAIALLAAISWLSVFDWLRARRAERRVPRVSS